MATTRYIVYDASGRMLGSGVTRLTQDEITTIKGVDGKTLTFHLTDLEIEELKVAAGLRP